MSPTWNCVATPWLSSFGDNVMPSISGAGFELYDSLGDSGAGVAGADAIMMRDPSQSSRMRLALMALTSANVGQNTSRSSTSAFSDLKK